jgi:hypothetical protein
MNLKVGSKQHKLLNQVSNIHPCLKDLEVKNMTMQDQGKFTMKN